MNKALITSIILNLILLIGIFIYAKTTINNTGSLNANIASLRVERTEFVERLDELTNLNDIAVERIGKYQNIQRELTDRNRQLESTVDNLTRIRSGIERSEHRATQYNIEARQIIKRLTEELQRDTIKDRFLIE